MLKLFRITTVHLSLETLLKGQLRFMNQHFDVTAIASGNLETVAEYEGVKTISVEMARDISLMKDFKALLKLYSLFRKERPFIVHANTPKASLLSMLAAKAAGITHRLYTVTGLRFESESGLKRRLLITMEKIACWAATKVIPEGQGVKNTLLKNKITAKELKVIANGNINGINTDYFSPASVSPEQKAKLKRNLQIQDNDFVFCFVGRLVKDKGINELVNAFSQLSTLNTPLSFGEEQGVRLLLVGPFERELDPLIPETEHEIKKNQNIISVGSQTDVRPFMAISDVFVFPSYREGFPNVVMQAGAMELPCIVTDINGCNEIIEDGVNGLIIPPKNVEAIKEKMLLLLNDSDLRKRLQSNARKMITSRYEQKMVWEAMLEEYKSLEK